jgi:hypothetical protein
VLEAWIWFNVSCYREILNGILSLDKISKDHKRNKALAELLKAVIVHLQALLDADLGLDDIGFPGIASVAE